MLPAISRPEETGSDALKVPDLHHVIASAVFEVATGARVYNGRPDNGQADMPARVFREGATFTKVSKAFLISSLSEDL